MREDTVQNIVRNRARASTMSGAMANGSGAAGNRAAASTTDEMIEAKGGTRRQDLWARQKERLKRMPIQSGPMTGAIWVAQMGVTVIIDTP